MGNSRTPENTASFPSSAAPRTGSVFPVTRSWNRTKIDSDLRLGFALEELGHHGCRGVRDGAAGSLESRRRATTPFSIARTPGHPVAAQRIVSVRVSVGPFGPHAGSWGLPAVVEDDLLIQVAQVGHQPKISWTRRIPRTSASISSRVLYSANEALAVAGTPKRSMTGCAQWWPARIGDPLVVEDGADVVGVDSLEHEGEHGRLLPRGADDANTRNRRRPVRWRTPAGPARGRRWRPPSDSRR